MLSLLLDLIVEPFAILVRTIIEVIFWILCWIVIGIVRLPGYLFHKTHAAFRRSK